MKCRSTVKEGAVPLLIKRDVEMCDQKRCRDVWLCSVLQCVAVCCSVLQCDALLIKRDEEMCGCASFDQKRCRDV